METEMEMDASPSYFNPEDLSSREQFRRYRKRQSTSNISPVLGHSVSKISEARLLYEDNSIQRRPNASLLLEEIKQEVDNFDRDELDRTVNSSKRRASLDSVAVLDAKIGFDSGTSHSLRPVKHEDEVFQDSGESTFTLFASLIDSALQGLMSFPDLILRFERTCRTISESFRSSNTARHRIVEDKFIKQRAKLLLDEAASWSLLWYLFGKGNEELPGNLFVFPTTSHQEASQFVSSDHTAQLCLRVVLWLERLASESLDLEKKVRGSHVGSYRPSFGVWHHTQRYLKTKNDNPAIVQHVDFDAPTREEAQPISDDKKQDELLLEGIWALLRAGRLDEACELCRSAGQPWRAATLCPFGGLDQLPSFEAIHRNGKTRILQAIELESGIGRQWRLWKWASYCASEKIAEQDGGKYEMAVYASQCSNLRRMLPVCTDWEMDLMLGDISHLLELLWSWISPSEDNQNISRPHGDPQMIRFGAHVVLVLRYLLDEDMKDAFKDKLVTIGDLIIHMYAMLLFTKQHDELVGIYASQLSRHLCVDLFVQMMELRLNSSIHIKYKLFLSAMEHLPFSSDDSSKASFEEIIERVLSRSRKTKFSKGEGNLSDVAEQHRAQSLEKAMVIQWLCFTPPSTISNSGMINSKLLMRALMHSNALFREFALISMWRVPKMPIGAHMLLSFLAEPLKQPKDYLQSLDDHDVADYLGGFEDWREYYACDATYRNWLKFELENAAVSPDDLSLEEKDRATAAAREMLNSALMLLQTEGTPWLNSAANSLFDQTEQNIFLELHATAMLCLPSGECMCPDATLCTTLTSDFYSKVSEEVVSKRQLKVEVSVCSSSNYCIEIVLRCLAVDGDGLGLHGSNDGGLLASVLAAGFKGELDRFQAGVVLEIFQLDAWFSDFDGSLGSLATYIVKGLCRRCCLPEVILRCMQVSVSLAELGDAPDYREGLIELVASSESGLLNLFSKHQLQEFLLFERECCLFDMQFEEVLLFVRYAVRGSTG